MKYEGVSLALRDGENERGNFFINQLPSSSFQVTWINTKLQHYNMGFATREMVEDFVIGLAEILGWSCTNDDYEQYLTKQIDEHRGKAARLRKQIKKLGAKPEA